MAPKNTVRRTLVIASVSLVAACQDASMPTGPGAPQAARAPQAQDRLEAIFQRVSPEVMALPGTVFIDNDEATGRVVVGIENIGAARGVQNALARLGVAGADYAVELTPPIHNVATLRDRWRPTIAGIQIHFGQYLCTMGFNVDHSGGRSFITNSHCTNTQGGTEGTQYYQPTSTVDPTVIATEAADPTYFRRGACPRGRRCRHSDAARALYSSSVASNRGEIAQTSGPNNGSLEVTGLFTISSQDNTTKSFPLGLVVNKVGRTTGWTQGAVTQTCVNTNVSGSNITQLCQTFVSNPNGATVVGGGDSGSGVFRITSGSSVQLVGILWGGSSDGKLFVFSPLASVQQELGSVNAVK